MMPQHSSRLPVACLAVVMGLLAAASVFSAEPASIVLHAGQPVHVKFLESLTPADEPAAEPDEVAVADRAELFRQALEETTATRQLSMPFHLVPAGEKVAETDQLLQIILIGWGHAASGACEVRLRAAFGHGEERIDLGTLTGNGAPAPELAAEAEDHGFAQAMRAAVGAALVAFRVE